MRDGKASAADLFEIWEYFDWAIRPDKSIQEVLMGGHHRHYNPLHGPVDESFGRRLDLIGAIIRTAAEWRFGIYVPDAKGKQVRKHWLAMSDPERVQCVRRALDWWRNAEPISDDEWEQFCNSPAVLKGNA